MGGSIRVLHVDDDPEYASLATTVLERHRDRFEVETATSAEAGLNRLAAAEFDCVLSDYDMPERDGLEFLDAVQADYPDLPFVLLTGQGNEDIASEAIAAGVSDYLQKAPGTDQFELLASRIEDHVERARTERALAESEAHLRQAQSVAGLGSWHLDVESGDLHWSEAVHRLFDRSPESALTYEEFLDYVHPADRDMVDAEWQAALAGADYDVEHRIVTERGETRWVRERADVVFDEAGDSKTALGVVQDVTDRRERTVEIERYEAIVERTEDGILVFDADGRFEFVNRPVVEATGIPRADWIDEHVSLLSDRDLVSADEVAALETGIEDVVAGEATEVRVEVSPDRETHFEVRLTPFETGSTTDRVIGFSRDVTDRRERERALVRKNDRLERLTRIVGHDVRNPLNVAIGSLQLGREADDEEHFERVARALDRMDALLDDLLTVAQTGNRVGDCDPVDLAAACRECWESIETGDATLRTDGVPRVRAEGTCLGQLLDNLLRNAVRHGGPDVTITVGDVAGGFYVADDGPGFPVDDPSTVFETGFSTDEGGTGLGLSIVEEIAAAHGWEVRATSSNAGGARVEILGVEEAAG